MAEASRRTVVVGMDARGHSAHAFEWYAKYMHRPENEVILVHVPGNFDVGKAKKQLARSGSMTDAAEYQFSQIGELEKRYQQKLKTYKMRGTVLSVPSKNIGQTILDTAKEENAFAIVMGTRGQTGKLKAAVLGTVSGYLVKNADRPVVVVRKYDGDANPTAVVH